MYAMQNSDAAYPFDLIFLALALPPDLRTPPTSPQRRARGSVAGGQGGQGEQRVADVVLPVGSGHPTPHLEAVALRSLQDDRLVERHAGRLERPGIPGTAQISTVSKPGSPPRGAVSRPRKCHDRQFDG